MARADTSEADVDFIEFSFPDQATARMADGRVSFDVGSHPRLAPTSRLRSPNFVEMTREHLRSVGLPWTESRSALTFDDALDAIDGAHDGPADEPGAMREIEVTIREEERVELMESLESGRRGDGTAWSTEIDIGDDMVVELKVSGDGPDGGPSTDARLFRMTRGGLVDLSFVDCADHVFGDFEFPERGLVLRFVDCLAPSPTP